MEDILLVGVATTAVVAAMAILAHAVILDAPPGVYWYQFFAHDTMTMSLV
jgi:hypothetical protein